MSHYGALTVPGVIWGDPLSGGDTRDSFVLPAGTVAFLLTDIERSTERWEVEPDAMADAMATHDDILDAAVSAHGGVRPTAQGEGDSMVAAFPRASDAVLASLDAQLALAAAVWPTAEPLRVRMAVHTGEARFAHDGNYAGQAIIRAARLRAIAHGGQVLISAPARHLTVDRLGDQVSLQDLGEHRLKDLARPERVYQLCHPELQESFPPLRSLDVNRHNLPVQLSSFIGRAADIATVVELVAGSALVTVCGAGGAGKTRLALQAAAELADRWEHGTWWVELADVADPLAVAAAIAAAVGVKGELDDTAADALAGILAEREMLVVLDNCEHLVDGVAYTVERLLRRCPRLRVLATSREPLEVPGEIAWRIPPLAVPDVENLGADPVPSLGQYDSVRLFLDRAQRVRPNFHLTDDTAPTVAAICQRLDGIPLAIELAAARIRSLAPTRILEGLTDAIGLLTGSGRAVLQRQATLEASITWSHDLLAPEERVLLRRLAVFSGGCTLDAAEAVLVDDQLPAESILDHLDRLVAQSLVSLDDRAVDARYRLLETVRQYAARKLDDAGETEAFRDRHARYYRDVALQLGPALEGADEYVPLAQLVVDHDNIHAALDWLGTRRRGTDLATLCCALARYWELVTPAEGHRWITAALEATERVDPFGRARLLVARAGVSLAGRGDFNGAAEDVDTALAYLDAIDGSDERLKGRAFGVLAVASSFGPRLEHRRGVFDQAIACCERAGDLYGEVFVRVFHTLLTSTGGRPSKAWGRHAAAAPRVDALGNHTLRSLHHSGTANIHLIQGDYRASRGEADAAEAAVLSISRAAGVSSELILRRSVAGAWARFVMLNTAACDGTDKETLRAAFDQADEVETIARAEGFLYSEMVIELIVAAREMFLGEDLGAGVSRLRQAIARFVALGGDGPAQFMTWVLANVYFGAADYDQVLAVLAEGDDERFGFFGARKSVLRAAVALARDDLAGAEADAHCALASGFEAGFHFETARAFELLAGVAAEAESPAEGARLLGSAARLRDAFAIRFVGPGQDRQLAGTETALRAALGDEYDAAFAQGYELTLDEAVEYARRARGERKRPSFGWDSLTATELRVIEHAAAGLTNQQIAEKLFVSRETVKTHLSHVFTKLGVSNRAELATAYANRPIG